MSVEALRKSATVEAETLVEAMVFRVLSLLAESLREGIVYLYPGRTTNHTFRQPVSIFSARDTDSPQPWVAEPTIVRNEWENADTSEKNKKGCFWVFEFYDVYGF
ncbi:MAG: hypothetical protein CMG60_08005 [Candidatus Marinimicrobia bacterium]|nr:hypothetical protein [Candidatus Neomarinimicrobiota bacterium]|tara:strand:- start:310 stop:624 length:315 start_codon:yes stop_codon:yes gene_type:complete